MDCEGTKRGELLERYLAHRLPGDAQDELETHLLECAACSRELELLLLARGELSERAAEIRTKSVERWSWFHWHNLVFASMLLALLGTGYLALHWRQTSHSSTQQTPLTAQSTKPTTPSAGDQTAQDTGAQEASGTNPNAPKANDSNQKEDNLPSGGRRYIDSTLNSKRSMRDSSPIAGPAPNPSAIAGKNDQAKTTGEQGGENPTQTALNQSPILEPGPVTSIPNVSAKDESGTSKAGATGLTTAQGVELYKLGQVQAPAYAFVGVTSKSEPPVGKPTSGYSGAGNAGGPGRMKFQEAMKSYVAGKYGEAADYLGDAALLEPKAADINFYLGACRILNGHPQDSVEPLQKAVAAGNSPYLQSSHYYLAKAYVQMNQLENATEELQRAANTPGRLTTESKQLLAKIQALAASIDKN